MNLTSTLTSCDLIINRLTREIYNELCSAGRISEDEIYIIDQEYLDANNQTIHNVSIPQLSSDAANKAYVDIHKNKIDTLSNWTELNPTLVAGEIAVVQFENGDTSIKIGDGIRTFNELKYFTYEPDLTNYYTKDESHDKFVDALWVAKTVEANEIYIKTYYSSSCGNTSIVVEVPCDAPLSDYSAVSVKYNDTDLQCDVQVVDTRLEINVTDQTTGCNVSAIEFRKSASYFTINGNKSFSCVERRQEQVTTTVPVTIKVKRTLNDYYTKEEIDELMVRKTDLSSYIDIENNTLRIDTLLV